VVVRAILDSNGLDAVKVADVTAVNNNQRIVSLNLIGYGITTVPSAVAKLRLRHLKLGENKLTAIPEEIGLIAPLTDLGLKLNALAAIPTTLGNLIHLTDLNLSNNSLSTLPVELTNMTQLQALSVDYNHLTVVTDPVLTWLNTYSNNTAWA
jgi:Leucine-rich repeat (LRR) protein